MTREGGPARAAALEEAVSAVRLAVDGVTQRARSGQVAVEAAVDMVDRLMTESCRDRVDATSMASHAVRHVRRTFDRRRGWAYWDWRILLYDIGTG